MMTFTRFILLLIIGFQTVYFSNAQGISGPDVVAITTINQYQFFDDFIVTNPIWVATNGVINSQWQSGNTYYCNVTFNATGNQTLSFYDGAVMHSQYTVLVNGCSVTTPSTTFTYASNTTNASITRNTNPPTGETWYWQTSASGTSTTLGSGNTYSNAIPGATYYLRSRNNTGGCWSSALATAIIPGNASVTNGERCGTGTVSLSATIGANGSTVRWFTASSGGTHVATSTSYTTPSISLTTTYYASTYNSTTGAYGLRIPVTATVHPASVGGTLSISNQELHPAKGTLTVGGITGSLINWEINTGSGWNPLGITNTSILFNNPDYLSAQYRAVVKSGTCASAYSSVMRIERKPLAYATTLQLTAPSGGSYQWFKNGASISGATQQNYTVNDVGIYSVKTGTLTTAVFYVQSTVYNQVNPVNAVSTISIKKAGVTLGSNFYTLLPNELTQVISYQDGMGRTFQQVAVGQSPTGKDIIAATGHGRLGMLDTTYLPYVSVEADGRYRPQALKGTNNSYTSSEQYLFYQGTAKVAQDAFPFARTIYRNTPDAKVTQQGAPGSDWQPGNGHMVTHVMTWNNSTTYRVRYWKPDGTTSSNYTNNSIAVSVTTDENGYKVRTFTNALGQTVLKQVQIDETLEGVSTAWLETYYVYDEFGRLKYIVPPKAMKVLGTGTSLNANNATVSELIYRYTYDNRDRLTIKKEPGANDIHIVYDNHDRPVFTQDGNLRSQNRWRFVKYDRFNRVVYTGIYDRNVTRATLQGEMDLRNYSSEPYYEIEQVNATYQGYSNLVYPTTNLTVLAVNYYDHYDFDRNGSPDFSYDINHLTGQEASALDITRALPTGSKQVTINETGNLTGSWLVSAVFYDAYDRPIQTRSNNHLYLTTDDKSTVIYDFAGQALKIKTTHCQGAGNCVNLVDRPEYDHAGRVLKLFRQINSDPEQLLVQYEYNALGQLVDKKIHHTGSGNFLQSVDFRYTIRGWLKSINNAQLNVDNSNDETNDFFGLELVYNTLESGLANTSYFNGNISALKWKGIGGGSGVENQRSYKYTYDKSDRLKTATFQASNGSSWNKEVNTLNENLTYDHNGNIKTLARNQDQRGFALVNSIPTVTSTPQTIDNLTYTYASNYNRLTKVEDGTANTTGFKNGSNVTTEYTYNNSGDLTSDLNKGIGTNGIIYNLLGKPQTITFTDGKKIEYTYNASGAKLSMKTYQGTTLLSCTNYCGSFVYEGTTPQLSFFASPEGRVVKKGTAFEYEYAIADNQGNTRVVFSSAAPPSIMKMATFEGDAGDNVDEFLNVNISNIWPHTNANHTPGGSGVIRMNQNYKVGPGKSVRVFPGDVIETEVWAYYESGSGYGTTSHALSIMVNAVAAAFGGVSGGAGESGSIFNGVNNAYGVYGLAGNQGDNVPAAYLNYILFDKNYKVLDMGWRPVTSASSWNKARLNFDPINIKESGFIFVYLSYENQSNNWVYFDDFKVTHTKGRVIQYNEYYPFGLPTANSWTREDATTNNFLANGGTEWNATSNFYDLDYRQYDPILGRMNGIDPMAGKYASLSPYNYSFNDPVSFTDPSGADPADYYFYTGSSQYGSGVPGLTYDDYVPNYPREYVCGQCWRADSPGAVNFMSTAMGYGGSIIGGWQASTFGGITLPYYGQMRSDAQAVRNNQMSPEAYASRYGDYMGSGIGGLTNAMLSVNAANINYNAGTFTYEFGGKMYGGTYHTTNGIVTSTATSLVMQSVTGGWKQIGDLRVNDYEKSNSPIGNFITNHLEFEMSGQFTFGAQATIVPSPKGLLPLPYSRGSELSFDVNLGSVVLLGGSYNSNKGKNKTTIDDTNFVQSFGISFRGFSLDGERILSPFGKNDSWAIGLTFKGWGMEYNSSNELSVGYMPKFKWALGIGAQVSPKAIIKY